MLAKIYEQNPSEKELQRVVDALGVFVVQPAAH